MPAFSVPGNFAFDDYEGLVATINDWLDREDLTGAAAGMISLAESRMRRKLDPLFDEQTTTLSASDGIATLPTDLGTVTRVIYGTRTLPQLGVATGTYLPEGSEPFAYTLERDKLRVWPASDVTLTLLYQPTLADLTSTSATNDLLSLFPDLYFFGAMMFAEGYLANDNRAGLFKGLFDEALMEAARYFTRQRFRGPLTPRVAFVP